MKLAWTIEALADRRAIYGYIEADNPQAALTLDELIAQTASRLENHPKIGRLGRVNGTRELVVHRSYVLIYDIADGMVRILRVLHSARQWPPERQQDGNPSEK